MTAVIDRLAPFEFQMAIWGYDTAGQVAELTAMLCENPHWDDTPTGYPLWDKDAAYLTGIKVSHGDGGYESPPDWWALPHAVVHVAAKQTHV